MGRIEVAESTDLVSQDPRGDQRGHLLELRCENALYIDGEVGDYQGRIGQVDFAEVTVNEFDLVGQRNELACAVVRDVAPGCGYRGWTVVDRTNSCTAPRCDDGQDTGTRSDVDHLGSRSEVRGHEFHSELRGWVRAMTERIAGVDLNIKAGIDVLYGFRPGCSDEPRADSGRCKPASLARRPIVLRVVGDVDARDQRRVCLGDGVDRRIRLSTIGETSEQGPVRCLGYRGRSVVEKGQGEDVAGYRQGGSLRASWLDTHSGGMNFSHRFETLQEINAA